MGVTYKAEDLSLTSVVALKAISPLFSNNEQARERLQREARHAARLKHANVASVFHLGNENGAWFYAMEFVEGETVEQRVRRDGPLDAAVAMRLALQIVEGLSAAHEVGVVHRDVKPANLMITKTSGGREIVKVIDFGIAKAVEAASSDATMTMDGFIGTALYASPEQIEGEAIDGRSDVYSLGGVLWFMLTGAPPFLGTIGTVMARHLEGDLPMEKLDDVPECVRRLLPRMLAKKAEDRPLCGTELVANLNTCIEEITVQPRWEKTGVLDGRAMEIRDSVRNIKRAAFPISSSWMDDAKQSALFQQMIRQLADAPHPGVLAVECVAEIEGVPHVIGECAPPFSLLEMVRSRGALPLREAMHFLQQLAEAVDHCSHVPGCLLHIHLRHLRVRRGGAGGQERLVVSPLGAMDAVESNPENTLFAEPLLNPGRESRNDGVVSIGVGMAMVAHELLIARPAAVGQFKTIARLSEEANYFMREALSDKAKYESAHAFCEGLGRVAIRETQGVESMPSAGNPEVSASSQPADGQNTFMRLGLAMALIVCGLGAVFLFFKRNDGPAPSKPTAEVAAILPEVVPSPTPVPTRSAWPYENSIGMTFVLVEGADVAFSTFETRVSDYSKFAEETGRDWVTPIFEQSPEDPAVMVSWQDAVDFCAWLTAKEQPRVYRLPKDTEWSVAMGMAQEKGSTPSEKNAISDFTFPWGDEWPPQQGAGNFAGTEVSAKWMIDNYTDGFRNTAKVGSFNANQHGLHDMSGNVWEWCSDWQDHSSSHKRVARGGSYIEKDAKMLRRRARHFLNPDTGYPDVGFRVVLVNEAKK